MARALSPDVIKMALPLRSDVDPFSPNVVLKGMLDDRRFQDLYTYGTLSSPVSNHGNGLTAFFKRGWLEQHDITLAGRYSEWEYYNSDHAFLAGKKAAEHVGLRLDATARSAHT